MSKGFDMLRDYIEHDALCMRHHKCCDFEHELQQEFAALEAENAKLKTENYALNNFLSDVAKQCGTDSCPSLIDYVRQLRELAQDYDKVLSSMHALCDCDFVPLNDATLLALRSRMYELGIEVGR